MKSFICSFVLLCPFCYCCCFFFLHYLLCFLFVHFAFVIVVGGGGNIFLFVCLFCFLGGRCLFLLFFVFFIFFLIPLHALTRVLGRECQIFE